jgi:predicted dehydrogenase
MTSPSRTNLEPAAAAPAGAVGLVGLGQIGQVHALAVRRSPAARLVAVADTAAELLEPFAAGGVRAYRDAAELIADPGVGTVSICLPHDLHFPVARRAITAGKNVLVEKPLAIGLDQGQELVDAAAAAGVALGVSHNQVFYSPHAEAKRLIDTGGIGRPVLIRLRLGMGPPWGDWRDAPERNGGGLLSDAGVHRLYLALFFFGPVREAHAVLDVPGEQGETFAVAVLEFASGALGLIEANQHGPRGTFDDEIEITGSDAILRLGGIEALSFGYRAGPALSMFRDRRWAEVPVPDDDWQASVQASVAAYLDAVTSGREPPVTGAAALDTMRLLQRIYDTAVTLRRLPERADQVSVYLRGVGGRAQLIGKRPVRAAVSRGARLLAPALGERARVDGVIADRVEERGHHRLRGRVIARDGQGAAVLGAVRAGQRAQVPEEDVVEHLDDLRIRQVALEQLAAGGHAGIQLRDVPVALGIVVPGVEDRLAGQRLDRDLAEGLHRDADHHQVAGLAGLLGGRGPGERAELGDQLVERLGAAGVAQHYLVPGGHAEPGDRAADHPAADNAHSCHDRANPGPGPIIPSGGEPGRGVPGQARRIVPPALCGRGIRTARPRSPARPATRRRPRSR